MLAAQIKSFRDRVSPRLRPLARPAARAGALILATAVVVYFGIKERPEILGLSPHRTPYGRAAAGGGGPATVTALGRLEPATRVVDLSAPEGTRVAKLLVAEGDRVAAGAKLVLLDAYAEMEAARDLAKSQLAEASRRVKLEATYGDAGVSAAELRVRVADELTVKSVESQQAMVRAAEAKQALSVIDLERGDRLLADGILPKSDYDRVSLSARQAIEELAASRASLLRLQSDSDIQQRLSRAELRGAATGTERAQLALQRDSLVRALALAEARLERTVVRAPFAGDILKILTWPGERVSDRPLLKLGDTQVMYALAEIYETDAFLVKAGQRVVVTSKAFPGQELTGRVERVSAIVFKNDVLDVDPTADADSRVIEARIRLDSSTLAARFNQLQVDVAISVP